MRCCGVDLEISYLPCATHYRARVICGGCKKVTRVKVVYNEAYTLEQHRKIGRLTLEDRGSTGAVYITYPYEGDLEESAQA